MYTLIGGHRRSGCTLFFTKEEAQTQRKLGCASMVLTDKPVKSCSVYIKLNPFGFSKTGEVLMSNDGKYAVIL